MAGVEIGGDLDGDGEDGVALVVVGDDVARLFIEVGNRPLDGAGGEAGREGPVDFGGDAGVAGVLPVGVPAGGGLEFKTDGEGLAGDDGVGTSEEMGGDEGLAVVDLGAACGDEEGTAEDEEDCFQQAHQGR